MVEQDVGQGLEVLWLEEILNGASGQLGECIISWCEDGEWSFALEGVDQTGSLYSSDQGGEATIGHGGIDDVGSLGRWQ